jgi:hypothetical protein
MITRQLWKYILQDKKQHINYFFLKANLCLYLAEKFNDDYTKCQS